MHSTYVYADSSLEPNDDALHGRSYPSAHCLLLSTELEVQQILAVSVTL